MKPEQMISLNVVKDLISDRFEKHSINQIKLVLNGSFEESKNERIKLETLQGLYTSIVEIEIKMIGDDPNLRDYLKTVKKIEHQKIEKELFTALKDNAIQLQELIKVFKELHEKHN